MSHPVTQPSSNRFIDRVAQLFFQGKVYRDPSHSLLFVCGGPVGRGETSIRNAFIEYAKAELPNFRAFLSEVAAQDLTRSRRPTRLNLARFEELLAAVADCVILFLESPGSQAELGYFAKVGAIADLLLVVNNLCFRTRESFINNGPINLVDRRSAFGPTIHIDPTKLPEEFERVRERLMRFPRRYREKVELAPVDQMRAQDRLFLTLEATKIFCPIDVHGIVHVMRRLCGEADEEDTRRLISMLLAAGYIQRHSSDARYFVISPEARTCLDLEKFSLPEFRMELSEHYRLSSPDLYDLLNQASA